MSTLKASKIQVESGYSELETIDGALRELTAKGECDIAVVDYIQLVHLRSLNSNETREQHVSEITKRLKALALQLNITLATASQLNDEGKLRESRAIGHHSDHVWMISHTNEGAWIMVNKNREGERGASIPVLMQGSISRFVDRSVKA
jgi:replicative DNA helicase